MLTTQKGDINEGDEGIGKEECSCNEYFSLEKMWLREGVKRRGRNRDIGGKEKRNSKGR